MKCFLRMGSDYLEDSKPYKSIAAAKEAFLDVAKELDSYGQDIEASIYKMCGIQRQPITEYPDYILSFNNGKVLCSTS